MFKLFKKRTKLFPVCYPTSRNKASRFHTQIGVSICFTLFKLTVRVLYDFVLCFLIYVFYEFSFLPWLCRYLWISKTQKSLIWGVGDWANNSQLYIYWKAFLWQLIWKLSEYCISQDQINTRVPGRFHLFKVDLMKYQSTPVCNLICNQVCIR